MASLAHPDLSARLRPYLPTFAMLVLVAGIGMVQPRFLSFDVLTELAGDAVVLFLLAAGVGFVIMVGGIDLSVQATASLASVIVALTINRLGYGSFAIALLACVAAGCCAGAVHVLLRIPSFITTLAVSGVLSGAALLLSGERSIALAENNRFYLNWITGRSFDVPNELFVGALLVICAAVLQSRTRFGRYSSAIGAGEAAAYASGVSVDRVKIATFALSSACAALAGIVLSGHIASGSPILANGLLLPAIAAVVVGGTAITGGVGSIWRTLVGALIITIVRTGMNYVGVNPFAQQVVFGVVLVMAVAVTIDRSKIPVVK